MTECLHCRGEFQPRRRGHVFCSSWCRHRGEQGKAAPGLSDREQIAQLFDPSRDPEDRVREDDWHPEPNSTWVKLDLCKTVGSRRRWYLALLDERPSPGD